MRPVHFRSLAIAAAVVAAAGTAAAQEKPGGLLNNVELRQLAARAEPADHVRLGVHFTALADRYAAEGKRHVSMSQGFAGNPNRKFGVDVTAHCKRLADLNAQSASTVRELAAYHEKLASGTPAAPPRDAARFYGGAGALEPTEKELVALAARAHAPAEHRALEEYFLTAARRYTSEANEHTAMAQTYRGTRIALAATHHDRLARLARDAAKEANAAAEMHKQLAAPAR